MKADQKFCPLLSLRKNTGVTPCHEKCAWWSEDKQCVLKTFAEVLSDIWAAM